MKCCRPSVRRRRPSSVVVVRDSTRDSIRKILVKMCVPQHMEKYEKYEKMKIHENYKNIDISLIFEKIDFLKNIEKCKK